MSYRRLRRIAQFQRFIKKLKLTVLNPSQRQYDALGRYLHTLSAACFVGSAPIMYFGTAPKFIGFILNVLGLILLVVGLVFCEGGKRND